MQKLLPAWLVWSLGLLIIIFLALVSLKTSYQLKDLLGKAPQNTLSVTAQGKVKAVPDLATVDLGVITTGSTAQDVQNQSSKKINAIIEFIKKQGVDAADINTSQFSIYPQQDYRSGQAVITGYQANQNITVKVRGVDKSTDKLSTILGGVTGAGANQINGVSLSFDDPDNLRGQARQNAIEKAKQKAAELANAAGLRLGRIVNVSESTGYGGMPVPYAEGLGIGAGGDMKAVSPNVQPGNQDVIADMTIVFEVR